MKDEQAVLKLGLIGCGKHMTENLLSAVRLLPQIKLQAICTRTKESSNKFAAAWDIPCQVRSFSEFTHNNIDALICSGPVQLHEEVAMHALKNNIPLFVEKPLARKGSTVQEILSLAQIKSSTLQVGYNLNHSPLIDQLRKYIKPHAQITINYHTNKPKSSLWELSLAHSFCLAIAVHPLSVANYLKGPGQIEKNHLNISSDNINYTLAIKHEDGSISVINTSNKKSNFEISIHVENADGTFYELSQLRSLHTVDKNGKVLKVIDSVSPLKSSYRYNGFLPQIENFIFYARQKKINYEDLILTKWIHTAFQEWEN